MRTDDFFADLETQLRDARTGPVPKLAWPDLRVLVPVLVTAAAVAAILIVAVGGGPREQALAAPRTSIAHVREVIRVQSTACPAPAMTTADAPGAVTSRVSNFGRKDYLGQFDPRLQVPVTTYDSSKTTGYIGDELSMLNNLVATTQLAPSVCGKGWNLSGPGMCLYGVNGGSPAHFTVISGCLTLDELKRGNVVLDEGRTIYAFAPPGRVGRATLTANGRTYTPSIIDGSVVEFQVPRLSHGAKVRFTVTDERSQAFAVIDERTQAGGFYSGALWHYGFPEAEAGTSITPETPTARDKTLVLGRSEADKRAVAKVRRIMGVPPAPFRLMSDDQREKVSPDANILILAGDDYDPS